MAFFGMSDLILMPTIGYTVFYDAQQVSVRQMRKNLLTGVVVLLALLPLLFVWHSAYLPFADYPNHLAGVKIMRAYDSNPFYREYFAIHFLNPLPVPNMIFDLFAVKLLPFVSEDAVGRLFLSLYVLLSLISVLLLCRETGADVNAALLGYLPVLFGFFFQMAFLNFLLSIPLVFLALTVLLRFEKSGRASHLVAFFGISILVYLSHIFSFFVLSLIVMARVPWTGAKTKKIFLPLACVFLVAVGVYLMRTDISFRWHPLGISYKFHIMPLYLLTYPLQYYDGLLGDICLALYIAGICWLLFFSRVKEKALFLSAAVLLFCYAVFPFSGARGTLIDVRLLPFAALLFLVSLDIRKKERYFVPFVLFAIVLALKLYGSLAYYASFAREFPAVMSCMEEIGEKSVVLPIVSIEGSNINPYSNSWGYLILKKDMVTPYIFAGSQQPLGQRRPLFAPSNLWGYGNSYDETPEFWERIRETYGYVLIIGRNEKLQGTVRRFGRKQCGTSVMTLYRLTDAQ
jgi:hypothetical protein